MKPTLLILLLLLVGVGYGQTQKPLSAKYQQKLDKITDPYKKVIKYERYRLKDSLRAEKLKKQVKTQAKKMVRDSLKSLPELSEYKQALSQSPDSTYFKAQANQLGTAAIDKETGVELSIISRDSTQVREQANQVAKDQITEATGDEVTNLKLDSTTVKKAKQKALDEGEKQLKDTDEYKLLNAEDKDSPLSSLTKQKKQLEKAQAQLKEAAAQDKLKEQMAAEAKDFISKNADQIEEIQSSMADLKRKYSAIPNSNDLSTATKRKSLEGETFWKRLVLGGNFNFTKTNPVTVDLSPVLGYKINKLFEAGASMTYRTQFIASSSTMTRDDAVYGQSLWMNHLFYKNYFGYLEGERMSTVITQDDIDTKSWKESLMLGVGRKIRITKWLEMQALILFNLMYDTQDELYTSPVVFKTGLRVGL